MSALSDEFKVKIQYFMPKKLLSRAVGKLAAAEMGQGTAFLIERFIRYYNVCLLYTSPSPRDRSVSRMPSSA